MPELAFGAAAYRRENGRLPELRLINMFLENAPTGDGGVVLLSRRGLLLSSTAGAGPVRGVFCEDGVLGGAMFVVSGGGLYRDGTLLGGIAGTGPVRFAASADELVVTAGGTAYSYDGVDLQAIAFPDGAAVSAVAFISGYFIFIRAGTQKWYWSDLYDARSIDPLSFASAESSPDPLVDVVVISETVWLLGQSTIEPWSLTGDLDLPFRRIDERLFRKGVHAAGCAWDYDNSMVFIGSDGICYRAAAEAPQRISDHGIEERIGRSAAVSAFVFILEGHSFFCVRLDTGTFAYDAATGQWCEFATYGRDNFRGRCAVTVGTQVYLGDDEGGSIWVLSGFSDGTDPLERLFTAAVRIKGGVVRFDRVNLDVNVGWTDLLAGQGSNPQIEMRYSRDAGATWTAWEASPMGQQGQYRERPEWRALGMFDAPGAVLEFRVTDPVDLRLSAVLVNEPAGGRSR